MSVCRCISVFALLPMLLTGQLRNPVPLKHWATPLYWQPSQRESEALTSKPQIGPAASAAQLPTTPLVFVGITPCRAVDTRSGQGFSGAFGPPSLNANASRTFPLQASACAIPPTALGYSVNVTVVPPGPLGFITVYPTGQLLPLAATLTDVQGGIVGNAAIVAAGTDGAIDVYAFNATDLVIDVNGYYVSPQRANFNTALGDAALARNATGLSNTAFGAATLGANTSGNYNTAAGTSALQFNDSGSSNTATGFGTLTMNNAGSFNTALGAGALAANTTGSNNTAVGYQALANSAGSNNIGVGYQAGFNAGGGNGSNNIHVGSQGAASDNATIRIGTPSVQTSFYVAGVRGVTTANNDAIPVVIDSNGQLGTVSSSRRFKEDIQDMGEASSGLLRLHPVMFRYQKAFADGSKPIQYGLIAEEVAEVYPDLVAHSADGQIETVKYQVLDSMLLNEVQRQHAEIVTQTDQIRELERQVKDQQERMAKLEAALANSVQ